jgi:hypothetical protein
MGLYFLAKALAGVFRLGWEVMVLARRPKVWLFSKPVAGYGL